MSNRKLKVCIFTAARSEYGLFQWIISDMERDPHIDPSLIVGGGHLSPEQGMTVRQIESDGHEIAARVEFLLSTATDTGVAKSAAMCAMSMADVLDRIRPDVLLVLGDRYELMAVCSTALMMNIPIAHISGGDITEGAIDNQIRNAVTMMADLHFPCTEESCQRVLAMTGGRTPAYNVGEPGLETFVRHKPMSRQELAVSLGIDPAKRWVLCTLHTETKEPLAYSMELATSTMEAMTAIPDAEIIVTAANADAGGSELNAYYRAFCDSHPGFRFIHSLGHSRYLSMMWQAYAMIGNTSSGILEAPFTGVPVVNIGNRQKGRHLCANIITPDGITRNDIETAIARVPDRHLEPDHYFGDGDSSAKIIKHLKERYLK